MKNNNKAEAIKAGGDPQAVSCAFDFEPNAIACAVIAARTKPVTDVK